MLFQTYKSVLTLGGDLLPLFLCDVEPSCVTNTIRSQMCTHSPSSCMLTTCICPHTRSSINSSQSQRRGGSSQSEPIWVKHGSLQHMCRNENKGTGGPSYSTMRDYNYSATPKTFKIPNCLKENRMYDFEYHNTYISQHAPHKNWINVAVMTFLFSSVMNRWDL